MSILVQRVSGSWAGPLLPARRGRRGLSAAAFTSTSHGRRPRRRACSALSSASAPRPWTGRRTTTPGIVNLDQPGCQHAHANACGYATASPSTTWTSSTASAMSLPQRHGWTTIAPLPARLVSRTLMFERDYEAEASLREHRLSATRSGSSAASGLLERIALPAHHAVALLKTLENVYGTPVDIEYAVNTDEYGDFVINLLQCRPLYVGQPGGKVVRAGAAGGGHSSSSLDDSSMGTVHGARTSTSLSK